MLYARVSLRASDSHNGVNTAILEAPNVKKLNRGRGRVMAGTAVTAALFVPLAIFGAPALARSGAAVAQYQYGSGSAQYQYRVTMCHLTGSKKHPAHTITVSSASVAAHKKHGDHLGPCTGTETAKPKQQKTASSGTTTTTSSAAVQAPSPAATRGKGKGK
jgi:hypothetical protein